MMQGSGRQWVQAAGAAALLFLALNYQPLFGLVSAKWDGLHFFTPYFLLLNDYLSTGQIPFWNPWVNGGSPDFIDPQVGAFSPVTLSAARLLGGSEHGFLIYWLFIWLCGGLGMLALMRQIGISPLIGFTGAVGWLFSGFYLGHGEHTSHLYSLGFLPWMVWRFDVYLATGKRTPLMQTGGLWGLAALGGYPGLTALNGCYLALWGAGRAITGVTRTGSARRLGAGLAAVLITGLVIMAPPYYGFFNEGGGFTSRAGELSKQEAVEHNALHPAGALSVFSPVLPLSGGRSLWGDNDISSRSIYFSSLLLIGAVAALRRRSRFHLWLGGVGLLFLMTAMGDTLPLRGWLYELLPPFRYFQHAAIFRDYFIFCFCLLGASGLSHLMDELADGATRKKALTVITGISVTAMALLAVYTFALDHPWHAASTIGLSDEHPARFALWHTLTAWMIVPIALAFAFRPGRAIAVSSIAILLAPFLLDVAITFQASKPLLFSPPVGTQVDALRNSSLFGGKSRFARELQSPTNANTYTKTPTLLNYTPLINPLHLAMAANRKTALQALGAERIWFSPSPMAIPADGESLKEYLVANDAAKGQIMAIHPDDTGGDGITRETTQKAIMIRLSAVGLKYGPTWLTFTVTAPEQGWLMVTERWSPSWGVSVNREPVKMIKANFIWRGVPVTRGENIISFNFFPPYIGYQWAISWLVLAAIFLSPAMRRLKTKRIDNKMVQ